jgi:hypothetical protein
LFKKGARDEGLEVLFGLHDLSGRAGGFEEDIAGRMWDDRSEESPAGPWSFVALHNASFEESAVHGDDGNFLFSVGLFLGSYFHFTVELLLPAFDIRFDSSALTFAEVVDFHEWTFGRVGEGAFDHVAAWLLHHPGSSGNKFKASGFNRNLGQK